MAKLIFPKAVQAPVRAVLWCAVSTKDQTKEDKYSLPVQEADARSLCVENGWRVVEPILRVPGHSRYYIDIHKCAADMAASGIFALNDLIQLWETKPRPFDVLICRDFTRFARRAAMLTYIVEATLDMGAVIYSMTDGWVTDENSSIVVALAGFKTKKDISDLRQRREVGMNSRIDRGLGSSVIPMSHQLIFDDRGKPSHIDLNHHLDRLWGDFAELFLAGTAWTEIPAKLYTDYHHRPGRGKIFSQATFYRLLYNPVFWGHAALNYSGKTGPWCYDESLPVPDGVKVNRNTHPPVYAGELGELVKAELRRRENIQGRAKPDGAYMFTGLVVCAECGYTIAAHTSKGHIYWQCFTRWRKFPLRPCGKTTPITNEDLTAQIQVTVTNFAAHHRETGDLSLDGHTNDRERQLQALRGEIASVEQEIGVLIEKQISAPPAVSGVYTQKIQERGDHLQNLKDRLTHLLQTAESPHQLAIRKTALELILSSDFWTLDPKVIHQTLAAWLQKYRFYVRDGEIIGLDLLL